MRRILTVALLAAAALVLRPAPAAADVTAFLGLSTSPTTRPASGFSLGLTAVVVGFEIEYARVSGRDTDDAPGLHTGMVNALIVTPTRTQFYLTAGAGFFREGLAGANVTNFGTNIGGGVKVSLAGPIRLRLDYRVFNLRGNARHKTPHRLYAGLNIAF